MKQYKVEFKKLNQVDKHKINYKKKKEQEEFKKEQEKKHRQIKLF